VREAQLQSDIRKIDPALATVIVPARFNGSPASGNGGYSCGPLAATFEGPVAVSLRRPVPLDTELGLRLEKDVAERGFRMRSTIPRPTATYLVRRQIGIVAATV